MRKRPDFTCFLTAIFWLYIAWNNYSINFEGIRLSYGLKTGWGSYYEKQLVGGTLLTVTDDDISIEHIYKKQVY